MLWMQNKGHNRDAKWSRRIRVGFSLQPASDVSCSRSCCAEIKAFYFLCIINLLLCSWHFANSLQAMGILIQYVQSLSYRERREQEKHLGSYFYIMTTGLGFIYSNGFILMKIHIYFWRLRGKSNPHCFVFPDFSQTHILETGGCIYLFMCRFPVRTKQYEDLSEQQWFYSLSAAMLHQLTLFLADMLYFKCHLPPR